jgi:hypothetical protein
MRLAHTDGNGYLGICPPPTDGLFSDKRPENIHTMHIVEGENPHLEIGFFVDRRETIKEIARLAYIQLLDIGEEHIVVEPDIIELEPGQTIF